MISFSNVVHSFKEAQLISFNLNFYFAFLVVKKNLSQFIYYCGIYGICTFFMRQNCIGQRLKYRVRTAQKCYFLSHGSCRFQLIEWKSHRVDATWHVYSRCIYFISLRIEWKRLKHLRIPLEFYGVPLDNSWKFLELRLTSFRNIGDLSCFWEIVGFDWLFNEAHGGCSVSLGWPILTKKAKRWRLDNG